MSIEWQHLTNGTWSFGEWRLYSESSPTKFTLWKHCAISPSYTGTLAECEAHIAAEIAKAKRTRGEEIAEREITTSGSLVFLGARVTSFAPNSTGTVPLVRKWLADLIDAEHATSAPYGYGDLIRMIGDEIRKSEAQ